MRPKTWFTTHFYEVALIMVLTLLVCFSLWSVDWYPMHDSTHPVRLMLLKQTVSEGQFPAIWASGINQGYGYPLFHLYAPLFHYLVLAFSFFFSLSVSLKLTLTLTVAFGASGVWVLTHRFGRTIATLAVTSFVLSPFLALDLYVRGAYAELLSLALIPWVLHTISNLKTPKSVVGASFVSALFLTSHNLIPILIAPLILVWLISVRPPLKIVLLYGLTTLALSAWYLGPLLFERGFTQAENIAKTTAYQNHFVEPWQIWNSTWGFGGSAPGVEDGMAFKLGKLQLILAGLGALLSFRKKSRGYLIISLMAIVYLALATALTKSLWDNFSLLQLVQFPWRSLGPAAVLLSLLAGYALNLAQPRFLRIIVSLLLSLALIVLNLKYFKPQQAEPFPTQVSDIAPVVPEYLPVWMPQKPLTPSQNGELAYYPTWVVQQDGVNLKTYPSDAGLLRYDQISNSPVEISQGHTPLQQISYLLTTITLLLMAWYYKRSKL